MRCMPPESSKSSAAPPFASRPYASALPMQLLLPALLPVGDGLLVAVRR